MDALTRGIPSTRGSLLFKDFVPNEDSITVSRARGDGAIVIGKTNTPEFGLGSQTFNPVYGVTRNAWNDQLAAGGSSGGAASALALNMLPVNDGSDMMGSLRNPAAFNGIYGFRPSAGRVPQGPLPDVFVQQLGVDGPMGRNPQDCARLLATQAGYHARAPLSLPGDGNEFIALSTYEPNDSKPLAGKRIGWLGDMNAYLPMEPGVLDRCHLALKQLESLGASIEATTLGFEPAELWRSWLVLRAGLQGGNLGPMIKDPARKKLVKDAVVWEAQSAAESTAADFFQASAARSRFYMAMLKQFEQWDYLALPTAQVFPFDAELDWPRTVNGKTMDTYHRWMEVVLPATMAGLPAVSPPVRPSRNDGQATDMAGLQLIGPPRDDTAVLRASIDFYTSTST
jgi:amidase